jgi:hypothetical protein
MLILFRTGIGRILAANMGRAGSQVKSGDDTLGPRRLAARGK